MPVWEKKKGVIIAPEKFTNAATAMQNPRLCESYYSVDLSHGAESAMLAMSVTPLAYVPLVSRHSASGTVANTARSNDSADGAPAVTNIGAAFWAGPARENDSCASSRLGTKLAPLPSIVCGYLGAAKLWKLAVMQPWSALLGLGSWKPQKRN